MYLFYDMFLFEYQYVTLQIEQKILTFRASEHVFHRQRTPWYWPDFLFNLIGPGKENARCLKIMHDFTNKVQLLSILDVDNIQNWIQITNNSLESKSKSSRT